MLRFTLLTIALAVFVGCEGPGTTAPADEDSTNEAPPPASTSDGAAASADENGKNDQDTKAVVELEPIGDSGVTGEVTFVQQGDVVKVTGTVSGLKPGKHGFHVHEKGDLSDKETGKSAGGHYNPTDMPHGKPSDEERHVGDLGNIEANDQGVAEIDMEDDVITLSGDHSIVGKALVVHEGEDTFGQPTGDAGARVAFGLVEESSSTP